MLCDSLSGTTRPDIIPLVVDTARMVQLFATFGLRPAALAEIPPALALAEKLTHLPMVSAPVISAIHAYCGTAVFVGGQPIDSVHIMLLLSERGEAAVRDGTFTPADPAREHIASIGETCFGEYTGVYAGTTREARGNIMRSSAYVRDQLLHSVPLYARAATEDGVRSMTSLGFIPVIGGLSDLMIHRPLNKAPEAAA